MQDYRKSIVSVGDALNEVNSFLEAGESLVVFDLETTGLSSTNDRILSFSAMKVQKNNGVFETVDTLDQFINPGFPIPKKVTEINHISDADVKDKPLENEAAKTIRAFLGENPILCGYNSIRFDQKYLEKMYERVFGDTIQPKLHIDVMKMAKEKLPGLKSHKLETVAHELGCDIGLQFHASMDDVRATFRVFQMLLQEYEEMGRIKAEDETQKERVYVKSARFWPGYNHKQARIYVYTNPPVEKLYYDCFKNEWVWNEATLDVDALRSDLLRKYRTSDEKSLRKLLEEKK